MFKESPVQCYISPIPLTEYLLRDIGECLRDIGEENLFFILPFKTARDDI
jgi:hypothetical protein